MLKMHTLQAVVPISSAVRRCLALTVALSCSLPLTARAEHADFRAKPWEPSRMALEPGLGGGGPAGCVQSPPSNTPWIAPALADGCPRFVQFGPVGATGQTTWIGRAWLWSKDHWYLLAAPLPLTLLGSGGGGGGGSAEPTRSNSPGGDLPQDEPSMEGESPSYPYPPAKPVPEASAWLLFGLGGLVVVRIARRNRTRS